MKEIHLSALDEKSLTAALAAAADQLQGELVLEHPPLLRVGLFDLGACGQRLLVVIHHLVIDIVAWRVVIEDLQSAYEQAARGAQIALPAKTSSFKAWSEGLSAWGRSATLHAERTYWSSQPWAAANRLPRDADATGPMILAVSALDESETQTLLQSVPQVYRTQINDVLLTALARAFHEKSGVEYLLIDLEGHGREEFGPGSGKGTGTDVSRTVGWFTSLFPVLLLAGEARLGDALKSVKETLRAIPNRGIGYGVLRYLAEEGSLASVPEPQIGFNYLGRLDGDLADTPWLVATDEYRGRQQGEHNRPLHGIDINGGISNGCLRLVWSYDASIFAASRISALAQELELQLRALIAHCQESEGGFTPSDFPLAQLTQIELDRVVEEAGGAGVIEDI